MSDRQWPPEFALDLGDDHGLTWIVAGQNDPSRIGAIVYHHANTETGWCSAGVRWAPTEYEREHGVDRAWVKWEIHGEPDEHLTLSPSLLCSCGDHGFIRNGKWELA